MGARQAEGLQPRSRRAPQESDRVLRILSFSGRLFFSGGLFSILFLTFLRSDFIVKRLQRHFFVHGSAQAL